MAELSEVCGECKLSEERVVSCGGTLVRLGRGTTIHGLNRVFVPGRMELKFKAFSLV